MNVLFICTGNTCRSPMAEGIAKARFGLNAHSCGLSGIAGAPAAGLAITVSAENGIDISGHRSSPLTRELLDKADRVYVMTQDHADFLLQLCPEIEKKLRVMQISDPYGGNLDRYRTCFAQILSALEGEVWN